MQNFNRLVIFAAWSNVRCTDFFAFALDLTGCRTSLVSESLNFKIWSSNQSGCIVWMYTSQKFDSPGKYTSGLMWMNIMAFAWPWRESCSSWVSLESLKGTCLSLFARAAMTDPRALRLLLMAWASFMRSPVASLLLSLSLPVACRTLSLGILKVSKWQTCLPNE